MTGRYAPVLLLSILAACGAGQIQSPETSSTVDTAVAGSSYATILNAPPAPYPVTPPSALPQGEDLIATFARENGISREQAANAINGPPRLREAIARLQPLFSAKERGNYVGMVMTRKPGVRMEVFFKRDAAATLAKYTSDPLFVPMTGGLTPAEVEAVRTLWTDRLGKAGLSFGSGGRGDEGVVNFDLGISEDEFTALKRTYRWPDDPRVRLSFVPPQVQPAMADGLDRLVRIFARSPQAPGLVPAIASWGRVYLKDGCFRVARGGQNAQPDDSDPLALFGRDAQLMRDEEGYLIVAGRSGSGVRIGEPMQLGWVSEVDEGNVAYKEAERLREVCGLRQVVDVAIPQSARDFKMRPWTLDGYAQERKLSRQAAWDEIVACWKTQDTARAKLKPREMAPPTLFIDCDSASQVMRGTPNPPPPVDDPTRCPDGSTLTYGLCRDKDGGYVPAQGDPPVQPGIQRRR